MDADKSYKDSRFSDDTVFNAITKYHISLKDNDIKTNNILLREIVTNGLIPLMKEDVLFKDMFKNINYAGSYFKGTKVGKPDEYDLDLAIRLPLNYKTLKVETNDEHCGYVKIKVESDSKLPKWETHRKILNKWLDNEGYLDQNKFHRWMEGIMQKTYDRLNKLEKDYELTVKNTTYILKQFKKSGPAFTIYVKTKDDPSNSNTMDVDIVPCLEFDDIELKDYKTIPNMSKKMIVVAKPLNVDGGNRLWRLSFYEQEKQMLMNSEAGKMKPIIRMLKKFRDNQQWKQIASYYIETLFLHELSKRKADNDFFRTSQTSLFMHMLRKLREVLFMKRLEYFWHDNYNLLHKIDDIVLENCAFRLNKIMNDIEKNFIGNRFIIAEQILGAQTAEDLRLIVCSKPTIQPLKTDGQVNEVADLKSETFNDVTDFSSKDSDEPENIENRINQICGDIDNILKIKKELSADQLEKLYKACKEVIKSKNEDELLTQDDDKPLSN